VLNSFEIPCEFLECRKFSSQGIAGLDTRSLVEGFLLGLPDKPHPIFLSSKAEALKGPPPPEGLVG
jgi:hypothetical protein